MAFATFINIDRKGGQHGQDCIPRQTDQGPGFSHEARFDHAWVGMNERGGGVEFGCFFESKVRHDDGVDGGVFDAEVLFQVHIGQIE